MIGYHLLGRQELLDKLFEKDRQIVALEKRIAERGIVIRGWWCMAIQPNGVACDAFNGEEKEIYTSCRRCGAAKPNG